eukprot:CAMPEP_0184479574 /NCGR_PEP_ID=MMETSP0113_2-20130426/1251_1 /TAXON_ID=91329 /ORGANISM="Norrisiella sphaerica, Strain BC52" /LENGTH=212 /DNA_ID=CAMNT_0026857693 /DNA_START=218 /DNA_END=856 /DNA_ORIENTATION=+
MGPAGEGALIEGIFEKEDSEYGDLYGDDDAVPEAFKPIDLHGDGWSSDSGSAARFNADARKKKKEGRRPPNYPKDWSDQTCHRCKEKGHPVRRCPIRIAKKLARKPRIKQNLTEMFSSYDLGKLHRSPIASRARLSALYRPKLPSNIRKGSWVCCECGKVGQASDKTCAKCKSEKPSHLPILLGDFSREEDLKVHMEIAAEEGETLDPAHHL